MCPFDPVSSMYEGQEHSDALITLTAQSRCSFHMQNNATESRWILRSLDPEWDDLSCAEVAGKAAKGPRKPTLR